MTKLVVVLAVVIVVIVVIVIIAARSMRAEDPAEFTDRPGGRGPSRGGQDNRDARYERRERHPGRGGRPSQRQGGSPARPAGASAGRGVDDRRDQRRSRGYDQRMQDGRGRTSRLSIFESSIAVTEYIMFESFVRGDIMRRIGVNATSPGGKPGTGPR